MPAGFGGFSQQSKQARSTSEGNLGEGHAGEYRTAQGAYYTDPKIAERYRKAADAKKKLQAKQTEVQRKRAAREAAAEITQANREKLLEQEQAEVDARRRRRVIETSQNPISISAAENIKPYEIAPQNNDKIKVITVGGSFATPKSHLTKAISFARDGFIVRVEVMPAAKIRFTEYVQNQVKRLKLSQEHASRIIIADKTVKQSEKFNPDQVAVGDVSQTVRESAKGASADPLKGLE